MLYYRMYFCSDRFSFNGNCKRMRYKHAAFLSSEISSLGAIFDLAVFSFKRFAGSIFMYIATGMVVSKSFSKEQRVTSGLG